MKELLKILVQVVYVLSFFGVILVGVLGIIYEIIGHAKFEDILSKCGISKGFEYVWIVGIIMLLLLIFSYLVRTKLLNK